MVPNLTENAILNFVSGITVENAIVQVLSVKVMQGVGGTGGFNGSDRLRLQISDGVHSIPALLNNGSPATIQNCQENCFMMINKPNVQKLQGKYLFILVDASIVHPSIGHRIETGSNGTTDINKTSFVSDAAGSSSNNSMGAPYQQQRPLYNSTNQNNSATSSSGVMKPGMNPHNNDNNNGPSPMIISPAHSYNRPGSSSGRGSNPYGPTSVTNNNTIVSSNAPIVRSVAMATNITPIKALNMYNNRWTIKGRITTKTDIRTWSNSRGEGQLFSIDILDSEMDIRGTFFKEAVDKFYSMLTVGSVYTFTGGRLKVANLQFNTCKSSFEITFDQNSEIHLVADDSPDIQRQSYEFIGKISDIEHVEANRTVDVLAIVKSVSEPVRLMSKKTGSELVKSDLILIDDSNTEVMYTVWGGTAEKAVETYSGCPVVAIRRARVSDYNGKSIGAGMGSAVEVNPMYIPKAKELLHWWENIGKMNGSEGTTTAKSLSVSSVGTAGKIDGLLDRKDIASIKNENLGLKPDKADWLTFKGTCVFVKKDKDGGAWYPACPNPNDPCKNLFKVSQATDGKWFCEKCSNYYDQPVRRWIFSAKIEDPTGSTWVSFFNDQAQMLLDGISADEAYQLSYPAGADTAFNADAYENIFTNVIGKEAIFKCKVKNEVDREGESRLKTAVQNMMFPINYVQESIDMLNVLQ